MSDQQTKPDKAMLKSLSTPDLSERLSEIRIVMVGGRELGGIEASGKSSAGNIILRRNAFVVGRRTARSVQASANVHGRHVTVVDTPSWWWHYTTENTPKFDLLEIMRSPTLCPPGPHTFLLVIPIDLAFPDFYRMALEQQLKFLSEKVWKHIILLFTSTKPRDERSCRKMIRNWPDLKRLLQMCQNRYHLLNINDQDDSTQVISLLRKIEEMVALNKGQCFTISQSISGWDKQEKSTMERVKQTTVNIRVGTQHLTDMRVVILGASWAARSSAGNLILGEEALKVDESRTTVTCEVKHAEVHGRSLTVVDTPGWFYNSPLEKTSEIDKLEIRQSVYLCPPGPHAILLTVPAATAFNKSYQIAVKEHMGLLGENIWNHTIVLFTRGDWLGDTTIEERIETEEGRFEWLMEQCGNRYHVFNCKQQTDSTQVLELLEKIEEMVMENNSRYFLPEMDGNPPSNDFKLKMETAKTDMMKMSKQRHVLQELLKDRKYHLSDLRLVLLGTESVGKSKTGNIILKKNYFKGTLVEGYEMHTTECMMKDSQIEGHQVFVVDTPGCSTSSLENDKEILRSVTVCSPGPHAFLLVLSARESFTKKSQQTVKKLMSLFGDGVWKHTIIIFFVGNWLGDRPVEEYIACEGEDLQELIGKCGNRYHVLDDEWNNRSQVRNLLKMIEQMVTRNRGKHFTLEKKASRSAIFRWLAGSNPLTEEEWVKREDELIDRVMKALEMDEESKKPSHRRRQSFDGAIPSMSGESGFSDGNSLYGANVLNSAAKVSQWLRHPGNDATSSGYDSMSIASSSQYQKMHIPVPKDPVHIPKPADMSSQYRSRLNSV